jgi:hypothetical protein
MIAFSSVSDFQVRLPSGIEPTFSLRLIIYIRDTRDCITEWNLTSIVVRPDSNALDDLTNPQSQLLVNRNQNTVGQVISSLAQQLNQMNTRNLQDAASNGMPRASISISALGTQRPSSTVIDFLIKRKNRVLSHVRLDFCSIEYFCLG